jgi:hypothetical protein
MHDHFFYDARPLADHRLFGGLRHLNDLLPSGCEVSIRGWTIDRPAFDCHLLLAQAY